MSCFACESTAGIPMRCSVCHEAVYCNEKCQKTHWKVHKKVCKAETAKRFPFVLLYDGQNSKKATILCMPRSEWPPVLDENSQTTKSVAIYHVKTAKSGSHVGDWAMRALVDALGFSDKVYYEGPLLIEFLNRDPVRGEQTAFDLANTWLEAVANDDRASILLLREHVPIKMTHPDGTKTVVWSLGAAGDLAALFEKS